MASLAPILTPTGRLYIVETAEAPDAPPIDADVARRIEAAFARGHGHGLLHLGVAEPGAALPPVLGYWRDLGARFVTAVCGIPDAGERGVAISVPAPAPEMLSALAAAAPPMTGAEYVTAEVLASLWAALDAALHTELRESRLSLPEFLHRKNPAWNLVGRVHLNLGENRLDVDAPFAFLATYTTRLSTHAKAMHVPLGQALREYAGAANKPRLLSLLVPVQRAAENCPWLRQMVDAGEIYHPLRWTPGEAFQFLSDIPRLEAAGIIVRVPAAWRAGRPPRAQVTGSVGAKTPSHVGPEALLDFQMSVTLDGESLTEAEIAALLAASDGLHLIRGRWVEVSRERLQRMLDQFQQVERAAAEGGFSFAEAMRMLSGANVTGTATASADPDWSQVVAGPWLAETLAGLRNPEGLGEIDPGQGLHGTLRPYQQVGVRWLYFLSQLGLGACLADDMGLGKTVQMLSLLIVLRRKGDSMPPVASASLPSGARRASLLVAPASLLANWTAEIERFAPDLRVIVAHPSSMPARDLKALDAEALAMVDLVITSYGSLARLPVLMAQPWRLAVLDEAQAIKNPGARQTRLVKQLDARARVALTGTPVENRLGDLWSLFDFLNPGLLGSSQAFTKFTKRVATLPNPYGPLRDLVRPYILRRLKTDRSVIADLPDKIEMKVFCTLSKRQAALYQQSVEELARRLVPAEGIERRGVVLSFLMRFKQICNHPSQWLGDGAWREADSGKFGRLRELAEVIAAKQEKALVFTQFRETTAPLAAFLASVFGRAGLVLHGDTPVAQRQTLVRRFQEDEQVPFFVLSLKAGGTGLNLTAASHVIHFDRWWNPAVEQQATDRAFRIGQTKNVLVHKLVCRGTLEEGIDRIIESKQQVARDLLEGGAEVRLTELSNDDLMKLVALDLHAASSGD